MIRIFRKTFYNSKTGKSYNIVEEYCKEFNTMEEVEVFKAMEMENIRRHLGDGFPISIAYGYKEIPNKTVYVIPEALAWSSGCDLKHFYHDYLYAKVKNDNLQQIINNTVEAHSSPILYVKEILSDEDVDLIASLGTAHVGAFLNRVSCCDPNGIPTMQILEMLQKMKETKNIITWVKLDTSTSEKELINTINYIEDNVSYIKFDGKLPKRVKVLLETMNMPYEIRYNNVAMLQKNTEPSKFNFSKFE